MLEKSSTSYLGAGCREETRTIKCGADECRRRGLDRAEPVSAP